jgi:two-component system, response regulator PdtaR
MATVNKPVILVVDDEQNALLLRKLVLQKKGYEVITAGSAHEALQIAASRTDLDMVITDHLMPGVTGAELARQIKSKFPKTHVLLLSGVNEIPPGAEVADIFLSKVEGPDNFCTKVAALLSGSTEARADKCLPSKVDS